MNVKIEASWKNLLSEEFEKEYFKTLSKTVRNAYTSGVVYPPPQFIFHAFKLCPVDTVKVVVLGQDPYHGNGQAHGLCFSVQDGIKTPPSLQNIYTEIYNDLGKEIPKSGNLERWARQGVLLLNTTLTVLPGQPASHQGLGWEQFTDAVMSKLSKQKEHVVFLLWGRHAIAKKELIDETKHLILTAPHPSPFSAHSGFFGSKHFGTANAYLGEHGKIPIDW